MSPDDVVETEGEADAVLELEADAECDGEAVAVFDTVLLEERDVSPDEVPEIEGDAECDGDPDAVLDTVPVAEGEDDPVVVLDTVPVAEGEDDPVVVLDTVPVAEGEEDPDGLFVERDVPVDVALSGIEGNAVQDGDGLDDFETDTLLEGEDDTLFVRDVVIVEVVDRVCVCVRDVLGDPVPLRVDVGERVGEIDRVDVAEGAIVRVGNALLDDVFDADDVRVARADCVAELDTVDVRELVVLSVVDRL